MYWYREHIQLHMLSWCLFEYNCGLSVRSLSALQAAAKQTADSRLRKAPVTGSQALADTRGRQGEEGVLCEHSGIINQKHQSSLFCPLFLLMLTLGLQRCTKVNACLSPFERQKHPSLASWDCTVFKADTYGMRWKHVNQWFSIVLTQHWVTPVQTPLVVCVQSVMWCIFSSHAWLSVLQFHLCKVTCTSPFLVHASTYGTVLLLFPQHPSQGAPPKTQIHECLRWALSGTLAEQQTQIQPQTSREM